MIERNISDDVTLAYLLKRLKASIFEALFIAQDNTKKFFLTKPTTWLSALGLGSNGNLPITVEQGGTGQTGNIATSDVSSIIAPSSGITIINAEYTQWGKVAQLFVRWKRSSTISVGADGNASNVVIGTVVAGKRPRGITTGTSYGDIGGPAFYLLDAAGVLQLGAAGGTGASRTVAANTEFHCGTTYLLP